MTTQDNTVRLGAELLTVPEVAALLRKSVNAVRIMCCRGEIPGIVRIGRTVRFRAADVRKWLGLAT